MIVIKKSETADTRTCDFTKVTKEQLVTSSLQHIGDVAKGLAFFADALRDQGAWHDVDKLKAIAQFHADFVTGFKQTTWWDNHRRVSRHHLSQADGVPDNVDLIDVIEYITDCVMAGLARSGKVREVEIPTDVLKKAFENTVKRLETQVKVED